MQAKRVLLLLNDGPGAGLVARERLDIALMALALEETVSVVFVDDGVYQLLPQMDDGAGKSLLKTIRSLPLYDIDGIYVERESLLDHRLGGVDPIARVIDRESLRVLIGEQDLLL